MGLKEIMGLFDKSPSKDKKQASSVPNNEATINPHHVTVKILEHIATKSWKALLLQRKLPVSEAPFRGRFLQGVGPVFDGFYDRYIELVSRHRRRARVRNPQFDALHPVDCLIFTIAVFDEVEMDHLFDLKDTANRAGVSQEVLKKEIRSIIVQSCVYVCFDIDAADRSTITVNFNNDILIFVNSRLAGEHAKYDSTSSNNRIDRVRPVLDGIYQRLPARKNRVVRVG